MITLVVKFMDETKKVQIPDGASVTFGPSIPGPASGRHQNQFGGYEPRPMEYALRIYEGATAKTPMIGVLTGVRSFHREDVKVEYDLDAVEAPKRGRRAKALSSAENAAFAATDSWSIGTPIQEEREEL